MTGLVTSVAVKAALGDAWTKIKAAASWLFLHPAWLVAIGFAIFGLVQLGEARHWRKADASDLAGRKQAEQAAATDLASLNAANAQIADTNKRIDAANAELASEQKAWTAKDAQNQARFRSTAAEVVALEAGSKGPRSQPCVVSDRAKKDLEGL